MTRGARKSRLMSGLELSFERHLWEEVCVQPVAAYRAKCLA
jgi:hypothetical protein